MYKGKEPCHGCGITGIDRVRYSKDELCETCKKLLKIGYAKQHDEDMDRAWVYQHHHAYRTRDLNKLLHEFLSAISNPYTRGDGPQSIKWASGSNADFYSIPKVFVEPLSKLFEEMEKRILEIEEERQNIPKTVADKIADERDIIYNEGVEAGRKLLMQLNAGEISMADFGEKLKYKEVNND